MNTNIYMGYAIHINGLGEFSNVNIKIIERLMGQRNLSNLTLIKYRDVLSKMRLMKTNRTWCPDCLQQMKDTLHPPYEKLIWNINHYEVCVEHSTLLKSKCNQCGKLQGIIHTNSVIGYCHFCLHWLGEINTISGYNLGNISEESFYKSQQIEELFNHFSNKPLVKSESLTSSFKFINDKLRENDILKDFSLTKLDITQEYLLNYGERRSIPQIGMLLKISKYLDINLVEILSGEVRIVTLKDLNHQSKIIRYKHRVHYEMVKQYLENTIETQKEYISILSLKRQLNISRKTLLFRFPELINKIQENNHKFKQNVKKKIYKYNHKNDYTSVLSNSEKLLNSE